MALTLTCDCGARFEVDDVWRGRELPCPDCGTTVRAPGQTEQQPMERPSWLALSSAVLAFLGLLIPVIGLGSIVVAIIALIRRAPGRRLALMSLGIGLLGTVFGTIAFWKPDLVPIGPWIRRQLLAGQIDASGPDTLSTNDGFVTITRPKGKWGQALKNRLSDPAVGDLQKDGELLLARLGDRAFVDVRKIVGKGDRPLTEIGDLIVNDLSGQPDAADPNDLWRRRQSAPPTPPSQVSTRPLEKEDDLEGREWIYEVRRGGRPWRFLIRAVRRGGERVASRPVYLLRAYAPVARFEALDAELRTMLDSAKYSR